MDLKRYKLVVSIDPPDEDPSELAVFESDTPFPAVSQGDHIDGNVIQPHPWSRHWEVLKIEHSFLDFTENAKGHRFVTRIWVKPRSSPAAPRHLDAE